MQITVNGEAREISVGETLLALLARLEIDARKVAVERNLAIVPKGNYADTALAPGDVIEIVHFIGGG
ncbi:MAG: sulfur carrier protein ThiS [Alphaproteobacteria bacterium]|nr:sulfur carrier protein ThiS [Alphaproteobacteria bacterium]